MNRHSREFRLHRRGGIPRKVIRSIRRRSNAIGLVLALGRFFMLLGVLGLVAYSYSLWGSENTPLRHLLFPAIVLISLSILIRLALFKWVRWTRRAVRIEKRKSAMREERNTRSQITRKL